jgi:predicted transposase YbfD/YdcC
LQDKLPDYRDNRGKRHELSFVVVNFMLAIIQSYTALSMSGILRQMERGHDKLTKDLEVGSKKCISLSQLRRVLEGLEVDDYNTINKEYFQREIVSNTSSWKSIDGKELRGNIDGVIGEKRAENIVLSKDHDSLESEVIGFYSGKKDSERNVAVKYITSQEDLTNQNFVLDALHTNPEFLGLINSRNGGYVVQVKANQQLLLEEFKLLHKHTPSKIFFEKTEKGHGRIETRKAWLYPVENNTIDNRWNKANMTQMICIRRTNIKIKTGEQSEEESFYISNRDESIGSFYTHIRKHWTVEVGNYIRDSNFGEDKFRSFNGRIQQAVASILTTIINQIQKHNSFENLKIMREELTYDKNRAYSIFAKS